jgi:hypothetical protein
MIGAFVPAYAILGMVLQIGENSDKHTAVLLFYRLTQCQRARISAEKGCRLLLISGKNSKNSGSRPDRRNGRLCDGHALFGKTPACQTNLRQDSYRVNRPRPWRKFG